MNTKIDVFLKKFQYIDLMEEMIARWIRETITEYEIAKKNQNYFKMAEMRSLKNALIEMRDKLLKIQNT